MAKWLQRMKNFAPFIFLILGNIFVAIGIRSNQESSDGLYIIIAGILLLLISIIMLVISLKKLKN